LSVTPIPSRQHISKVGNQAADPKPDIPQPQCTTDPVPLSPTRELILLSPTREPIPTREFDPIELDFNLQEEQSLVNTNWKTFLGDEHHYNATNQIFTSEYNATNQPFSSGEDYHNSL